MQDGLFFFVLPPSVTVSLPRLLLYHCAITRHDHRPFHPHSQHIEEMAFTTCTSLCEVILRHLVFTASLCSRSFEVR
ncbi:hypothetical protein F4604DRAFT_1761959 [Suillus subluteus]|nr:hypothetical protein F4604DRAFT_1761959 [Suillus subluteus]